MVGVLRRARVDTIIQHLTLTTESFIPYVKYLNCPSTNIALVIIITVRQHQLQHIYLCSFVHFVFIASFVDKHGSGLSILQHSRVHGESRGKGEERLLQDAAPHRAALRTHGRACS